MKKQISNYAQLEQLIPIFNEINRKVIMKYTGWAKAVLAIEPRKKSDAKIQLAESYAHELDAAVDKSVRVGNRMTRLCENLTEEENQKLLSQLDPTYWPAMDYLEQQDARIGYHCMLLKEASNKKEQSLGDIAKQNIELAFKKTGTYKRYQTSMTKTIIDTRRDLQERRDLKEAEEYRQAMLSEDASTDSKTTRQKNRPESLVQTAKKMHVRARTLARVQQETGKNLTELKGSMKQALANGHGISPDQAFQNFWDENND